MWVSRISEIIGVSPASFGRAAAKVVSRAKRKVRGITGMDLVGKRIEVEDGAPVERRMRLRLSFAAMSRSVAHR